MRSMRNGGQFLMMYRSLLDWEWYHDLPVRVLFLHLLLVANWRPGRFEGKPIAPGQVPTSSDQLAAKTGLTRQSVRTALKKLQSTNVITVQSTKRFSIVTIVNWAEYQFVPDEPTNKTTKRLTANQPPINHQSTTIEEGNKEERRKKSAGRSLEERLSDFKAACKAVVEKDPARLPEENRKEFLAYWVETTTDGTKMRFEAEKFFDHARRMDTWMKTAKKIDVTSNGFRSNGHGVKLYDGWSVEKIEAFVAQFKEKNGGRYPNSGDQNIPKAYKLYKEWI